MTRFDAYLLLKRYLRDRRHLRAGLATEAVMEALASRLGGRPERWGLSGLLAWLDRELTAQNPKSRGAVAAEMLRAEAAEARIVAAVRQRLGPGPHSDLLCRALAAAEPAALIVLAAVDDPQELVQIAGDDLARLADDPSIAPEASRTRVLALVADGVDLPELLELSRVALLRIASDVF